MLLAALERHDDLDDFRRSVRRLLAIEAKPDRVIWSDGRDPALIPTPLIGTSAAPPVNLPRPYLELAQLVICHQSVERLDHLYRLAWRLTHGERALLQVQADPLVYRLTRMRKSVARDRHKMTAFVRFRQDADHDGEKFVAWFEPQHHILRSVAPFFVDRFATMRWTILTPFGSIVWDRKRLQFGPPERRLAAPDSDPLDDWWRTYYAATFNPSRANLPAMLAEMPKRYWHNLPEAKMIPALLAKADRRRDAMIAAPSRPVPVKRGLPMQQDGDGPEALDSLDRIAVATNRCQRCSLYEHATRSVPGQGPADAALMVVGEQPGDQEDLTGEPFIGPAGQLLDRAFAAAEIDRQRIYVTNAVKHFKFEPRGKRRIHQKPSSGEIEQCRWWLDHELAVVRPKLVVSLGVTAARSLLGRSVTIGAERGRLTEMSGGAALLITVHPSYLLRLSDAAMRAREYERFVADLRIAAAAVPGLREAA